MTIRYVTLIIGLLLLQMCQESTEPATRILAVGQTTYYVATTGNDNNPGTLTEPWRTVQHAADSIAPGDTVLVRGGIYNEVVNVTGSGTADSWTTFRGYEGETAVLDGSGLSVPDDDSALFLIDSQSYLVIAGFELRNYVTTNSDRTPMAVYITGSAHDIRLQDNHIHHIETNAGPDGNAHGIAVYGTEEQAVYNLTIHNNQLHDLKLGNSEALVLNGNVRDFEISQNLIYDNDNIGIDLIGFEGTGPEPAVDQARDGLVSENTVYNIDTLDNPAYGGEQSAAGIYVDGGTRIIIERNRVYESNFGIEIASEHDNRATSFVTVRNNLLYHNHLAGLAMGGYDNQRGSTENCTIVNNTFFENDTIEDGNGELLIQYDTRDNLIKNNLFFSTAQNLFMTNPFSQNSGNIVNTNLYYSPGGAQNSSWEWQTIWYTGFAAYQAGSGNDGGGLFSDPELSDPTEVDLRLTDNSPARDRGENLDEAGEIDFGGHSRIQNGQIDIGAYEFSLLNEMIWLPLTRSDT